MNDMKPFAFPKEMRLRKRSEYLDLGRRGRRVQNLLFVAVCAPAIHSESRLGVTVTRKVGPAVVRNRIKRQAREWFRVHSRSLNSRWDVNIIAKRSCAGQSKPALAEALGNIFQKIPKEARH